MITAAEYRQKAEQCLRLADGAKDSYHKKNFLRLSTMWSEMATKTEAREEFSTTLSAIEKAITRPDAR